ncbi:hypothetical protein QB898_10185 [Ottowia sp. 10c7w1]|uniref:Uncharacterized protein n=2 Tax=Ottowia cancrivicina TaxID=3040346 RepID=A0AAW6RMI9_9BURK|nr:hypothetical protein [Ottowia sp. 10c7w1]
MRQIKAIIKPKAVVVFFLVMGMLTILFLIVSDGCLCAIRPNFFNRIMKGEIIFEDGILLVIFLFIAVAVLFQEEFVVYENGILMKTNIFDKGKFFDEFILKDDGLFVEVMLNNRRYRFDKAYYIIWYAGK